MKRKGRIRVIGIPIVVAVLVLSAGCITTSSPVSSTAQSPDSPSDTHSKTSDSETATESGSNSNESSVTITIPTTETETITTIPGTTVPGLPDEKAKERALASEKEFLSQHLENKSCLKDWGFSAPVVDKEARVINRTDNSVLVKVKHPYWYSKGELTSDTYSTATYSVTAEKTERSNKSSGPAC